MTDELKRETEKFIHRALQDEPKPSARVLADVRSAVLSSATTAVVLTSAAKVAAMSGTATTTSSTPLVTSAITWLAIGLAVGTGSALAPRLVKPNSAPVVSQTPARVESRQRGTSVPPIAPPSAEVPASPEREEVRQPALVTSARACPNSRCSERSVTKNTTALQQPVAQQAANADLVSLEDLVLLERAQRELRAGNGARALELLDAARPNGPLARERSAAEVVAACQAGQSERARATAEQFLKDYPSGPLAARVRASCAFDSRAEP